MKNSNASQSKLCFFMNSKSHENLKIRLYYDGILTQTEFFRMCVDSYLNQDLLFGKFLDNYKINKQLQSKTKTVASRALQQKGEEMLATMGLTTGDIDNIFDLLEEELPEL